MAIQAFGVYMATAGINVKLYLYDDSELGVRFLACFLFTHVHGVGNRRGRSCSFLGYDLVADKGGCTRLYVGCIPMKVISIAFPRFAQIDITPHNTTRHNTTQHYTT